MRKPSATNVVQAGLAALALLATVWLLWPSRPAQQGWPSRPAQQGWPSRSAQQEGATPEAYFIPTASATITRATPQRAPTSTPFVPTATPEPVIHVVKPGDVLGIIAREYGVSEKAIMEANGLKSDLIIDGQKLTIPSPQRTPVVTVIRTPTVTSTPTSAFRYVAPVPLLPADGAIFRGAEAHITLQWASTALLQEGEWYEIKLWAAKQGEAGATRFYSQASNWTVPATLHPVEESGLLYWTVSVVYRARRIIPLSPPSSVRHFTWQ